MSKFYKLVKNVVQVADHIVVAPVTDCILNAGPKMARMLVECIIARALLHHKILCVSLCSLSEQKYADHRDEMLAAALTDVDNTEIPKVDAALVAVLDSLLNAHGKAPATLDEQIKEAFKHASLEPGQRLQ